MTDRPVVLLAMGGAGQYQRMRPLLAALRDRGVPVDVFTAGDFEADVVRLGGRFHDLFAGRPLAAADDASRPITVRYVSYAGRYAEEVAAEVAAVQPSMVLADTYAPIGLVAARILDVPHVNLCHGHDVDPARFTAQLEADPRLFVAPACATAIDVLRERYGVADASPASFLTNQSPLLNIYFEPEQYLSNDTRRAFEPVVFFGSMPSPQELEAARHRPPVPWFGDGGPGGGGGGGPTLDVFVSFGTLVWGTFAADPRFSSAADGLAAVRVLADAFARRPEVRGLISLGRADLGADVVGSIRKDNVRVESYVDQWQVLEQADLFVTHNGLNSTHESIVNRVPMISYPFFWDHPPLAARCQELGLAVPLTSEVRAPVSEAQVHAAIDECLERRDEMTAALERAAGWETDAVGRRGDIVDRLLALR